ncbi:MAG: aminotransferase class V-fold PLP-dependent enzyme [Thermoplasmata archaeon]
MDTRAIRKDFPGLDQEVHGKRLVYLDNAATSQKPQAVIDKMNEYLGCYTANVHRAIHELGERATEEYEDARDKLRAFLNVRSREEVVYTSGTTEAINAVAYGWGMKGDLQEGDEIVSTVMEHHSNTIPWYFLQDQKGVVLKWVDIHDDGTLKMEQYDDLITPKTKLVTVTHCSNVLGTINPVAEIVKRAHEVGALCLVDAAQSVPHMPVDAQALDCDFLTVSGHKMLGPTGIGALYGREDVLAEMEPFLGGGEMIREVHLGWARWNDLPWKFEAGTPNIVGAIGLGAAVDYLEGLDMHLVREHEKALTAYALERLGTVEGLRVFGPTDVAHRAGVVSFLLERVHAHDIASILDAEGIAVRAGHHCAQPLMNRLEVPATSRASFYVYNTKEEADRLAEALEKVKEVFRL